MDKIKEVDWDAIKKAEAQMKDFKNLVDDFTLQFSSEFKKWRH